MDKCHMRAGRFSVGQFDPWRSGQINSSAAGATPTFVSLSRCERGVGEASVAAFRGWLWMILRKLRMGSDDLGDGGPPPVRHPEALDLRRPRT